MSSCSQCILCNFDINIEFILKKIKNVLYGMKHDYVKHKEMSSTNTFKVSYEPSTGGGNERVFLFWSNDKVGFIDHVQFSQNFLH